MTKLPTAGERFTVRVTQTRREHNTSERREKLANWRLLYAEGANEHLRLCVENITSCILAQCQCEMCERAHFSIYNNTAKPKLMKIEERATTERRMQQQS